MKIVDLSPEHEGLYCACLEDWSDEMKESGDHKTRWYCRMKDNGLRVKLALDDEGHVGGMIQYVPVEYSFAEGGNAYVVLCVWVHGYAEGRGNFQKKGMGTALLKAAEEDARSTGADGLAAWGVSLPFWMRASWFRKKGYKKVDKEGMRVLLWKPFVDGAEPPHLIKRNSKPAAGENPGKITVTSFVNGWCPAQNIVCERAKRAAVEFGDRVVFRTVDTFDRDTFARWGIFDALFIEDKEVNTGPPPSYEKLVKILGKRVRSIR